MKRFSRFALVGLAVCFAVAPLRAQEAPKKAPGPAPSPSEAVLEPRASHIWILWASVTFIWGVAYYAAVHG